MLSDQQGKACATGQKEAEKKFIKDSLVCWGLSLCNFFEQSFGGLVRWHADLSLRLHFYASWFNQKNKIIAKLPTCRRPAVQRERTA